MSDDLQYGIRLTASGGEQTAGQINTVSGAQQKATSEAEKLNTAQRSLTDTWTQQARAMSTASDEVQKILNRYDPLGAKLQSLKADFETLNQAAKSGGIPAALDPAVDQAYKRLTDEIAATTAALNGVGAASTEAFAKSESGATASAFATAGARRELIVLGHEAVSGNFSRMPGSFMVLAERAALSSAALLGVGGAIAVVSACALLMAKAFADGHAELNEMNNALQITSGYAGMTRGAMRDLAQSVSDTGTLTVGVSKQIVTQLVASGQFGAQSIAGIAKLADDYAHATGQSIDKITPELMKTFADPAKGAEELNRQMHMLSAAELEHIDHLHRIGDDEQARLILLEKTAGQLVNHKDQLGLLDTALNTVTKSWSKFWDNAMGVSRPGAVEEQLAAARKNLVDLQSQRFAPAGMISATQQNIARLEAEAARANSDASSEGAAAQSNAVQQRAFGVINQVSEYQKISELRDKIVLAGKADAQTDEEKLNKQRAIFDLNKQIEAVQRSMGAEQRAIAEARISGELQIKELVSKGDAENIQAKVNIGTITKQEGEQQLQQIALTTNAQKQAAVAQELSLKGLTENEKVKLAYQMAALAIEKQQIIERGKNLDLERQAAYIRAQAQTDASSSQTSTVMQLDELSKLDQEIAKLTEKNAQIGKTKEQIDLLKAAEIDRAIAQETYNRNLVTGDGTPESDPYVQRLDAQIDRLNKIKGLLQQGAGLEATDAANKKFQADFKKTEDNIDRGLTDALMRGFEGGKSFAYNFRDALVNMFKTMILKPSIQFILQPISAGITSALTGLGLTSSAASAASGAAAGSSIFSGLSSLFGGSQTLSDFGSFFGSIGATTETGATFGLMDALSGFAMANPFTAALGVLGALGLGSSLFGGGEGYAQTTGHRFVGTIGTNGWSGQVYGESSNGTSKYEWPLSQAEFGTSGLGAQVAARFAANGITQASVNIDFMGGPTDPIGDLLAHIDQIAPSLKTGSSASGSSTGGSGYDAAAANSAMSSMSAALSLSSTTASLFTGNLSPMTGAQKLDYAKSQYTSALTAAKTGDPNSINALSGFASDYLTQAHDYYASSSDYTSIFNSVQSDVKGLVTDTLTSQSMKIGDMGVSLTQIASNTLNLDTRIANAIAAAISASTEANKAIAEAQTRAIVQAIVDQSMPFVPA